MPVLQKFTLMCTYNSTINSLHTTYFIKYFIVCLSSFTVYINFLMFEIMQKYKNTRETFFPSKPLRCIPTTYSKVNANYRVGFERRFCLLLLCLQRKLLKYMKKKRIQR